MAQVKRKGRCFEQAYMLVVHGRFEGQSPTCYFDPPKIVHGIVKHPETDWHVHAWVEDAFFCYDFMNGKLLTVPKERYYEIGQIKTGEGEIFKYTEKQAIALAQKTGRYYFSKLPCKL